MALPCTAGIIAAEVHVPSFPNTPAALAVARISRLQTSWPDGELTSWRVVLSPVAYSPQVATVGGVSRSARTGCSVRECDLVVTHILRNDGVSIRGVCIEVV
ncbi:hypothetical protein PAXRUDRAFT_332199 [Paxillus rubicundulus Ve08.2h10]|uniref:Unplaced genomic scaffold scaffold_18, whole genome shotgun sequence n=1 Tax=Paxillus rubicundulus Ve08.2h10 TaxID=930991 RepID=A0A0D0ECY4_9AGAM|nr:hypothetical protein PAXRUDRAFT_332199 [Paxillus rubicundulus Ve08.2h10]